MIDILLRDDDNSLIFFFAIYTILIREVFIQHSVYKKMWKGASGLIHNEPVKFNIFSFRILYFYGETLSNFS